MDEQRFDALSREIGRAGSRRSLLGRAMGGAFVGAAVLLRSDAAEAVNTTQCHPKCKKGFRCHKKKCIRRECRRVGSFCDVDAQCCSGTICGDNILDGVVCCFSEGRQCTQSRECCGQLSCFNGTCQ